MGRTPILPINIGNVKGLMQAVDDNLLNMSFSPDCVNIDVSDGIISTMKGSFKEVITAIADSTINKIFYFNSELTGALIVGAIDLSNDNKWYNRRPASGVWKEIKTAGGASLDTIHPFYSTSLMAKIGATEYMILCGLDQKPVKIFWNAGGNTFLYDDLGGTPPKGEFITWHRERTWISGVLTAKNTIYFSNAFDPEDWSTAIQTGEIVIETFDGDSIIAIKNILDDVVIFKKNTIWRVTGDIPEEYAVEQIYSVTGTIHKNSVCTDGRFCFFATDDGIYQYNGVTAEAILTDEIKDIYKGMASTTQPIVCRIVDNKLYVFDTKFGAGLYVGKSLVYDIRKNTIEVMNAGTMYSAEVSGENVIYYTDGAYVYMLDDSLLWGDVNIDCHWFTPESDFALPNAGKTLDGFYVQAWGTKSDGTAGGQVKFTVYYNESGTEKTKDKTITLQTTRKPHIIQLSPSGRLFKLKIENVDGSAINIAGVQMRFEIDED